MDFERYLQRIDYTGSLDQSFETLSALHLSHMQSVPFENLDIHLGHTIELDLDKIFHKIVNEKRGGFCYELNGLFAELLRSVGFSVELLNVKVFYDQETLGPDFDHLALRVDEKWLADVGFGDSFVEPLKLEEGVQVVSNGEYQLVCEDEWFLKRKKDDTWSRQYSFTNDAREFAEFSEMCRYQQTNPESTFTQKIIVSKATESGRISYSNARSIVTTPERRTKEIIESGEETKEFLESTFGFDLQGDYAKLHQKAEKIRLESAECPLCETSNCPEYARDSQRPYHSCETCKLIFVVPAHHVSIKDELERYLEHDNEEDNQGYRDFLDRMITRVTPLVEKDADGLDFGCGPNPVLAKMMRERGFRIETYDPFFDNRTPVLHEKYDYIVSTEVFEHLSKPREIIEQLRGMLNADGVLFVMTSPYDGSKEFTKWHYRNDKTHISFYTPETLVWIADRFDFEYEILNATCHLFRKR